MLRYSRSAAIHRSQRPNRATQADTALGNHEMFTIATSGMTVSATIDWPGVALRMGEVGRFVSGANQTSAWRRFGAC